MSAPIFYDYYSIKIITGLFFFYKKSELHSVAVPFLIKESDFELARK